MLPATMAMRRLLRTTRQVAIATLAGLILLAGLNTSQAGNWWDQDFETNPVSFSEDDATKSWGVFKSHGYNPHNRYHVGEVTSGHPVRFGAQSIRFQVAPGQCGGGDCSRGSERSELLVGTFDRPGNDVWYSWSVYHQNYKFLNGGVSPIHGQFKTMEAGGYGSRPSPGRPVERTALTSCAVGIDGAAPIRCTQIEAAALA